MHWHHDPVRSECELITWRCAFLRQSVPRRPPFWSSRSVQRLAGISQEHVSTAILSERQPLLRHPVTWLASIGEGRLSMLRPSVLRRPPLQGSQYGEVGGELSFLRVQPDAARVWWERVSPARKRFCRIAWYGNTVFIYFCKEVIFITSERKRREKEMSMLRKNP